MCIIASEKNAIDGHKKRHQLIKEILKTDMKIDIFGRGIEKIYKNDSRIKGSFKHMSEVYPNYYFNIAIENCREGSYISEKLFHPLFYRTCPIYWGSSKVDEYTNDFYYKLPESIEESMKFIGDVYANYMKYYSDKSSYIYHSRQLLVNYNYLDFCYNYFKTGDLNYIKI